MTKKIKVGEVFRAYMVRKGTTPKGTYHFVKINLNEDEPNKPKELVTLIPQKGQVKEGKKLRISALYEFWVARRKYNGKWYSDAMLTCDIEGVAEPDITVTGVELPSGDLPF